MTREQKLEAIEGICKDLTIAWDASAIRILDAIEEKPAPKCCGCCKWCNRYNHRCQESKSYYYNDHVCLSCSCEHFEPRGE